MKKITVQVKLLILVNYRIGYVDFYGARNDWLYYAFSDVKDSRECLYLVI